MSPEEEKVINRNTMKLQDCLYKALKQRDQYKAERDTLIDDLSWYKAKVSRLEQRISKLFSENTKLQNDLFSEQLIQDEADDKIKELERENEELKEIKQEKEQLEESFQYQLEKRLEYFNKYQELKKENKALRLQADTYFDEWQTLEHENKRLTRLTHKLTIHRTMWDKLKDWRRDMLEIDKNDTQLISLGLVMDELEKDNLYKECD